MNWLRRQLPDPVFWGGVAVALVTQLVYLLTLNPSCPFWDSGEFIATSYVLGIPHPPGTPLYVLIGRLFTFLPIGSVAARVNYLSALAATLAVLFTYLVIVSLARRWQRHGENRIDRAIAVAAGMTGAFFMAFSRTFWDNAIEAEVYALSSFVMVLAAWLALRWEASGAEGRRDNNLLLLIGYLLFVAVGIHMGSLLVAPAIVLFVLLVSWRTLFPWGAWGSLTLTAGIALGVLLLASATSIGLLPGFALGGSALLAAVAWGWRKPLAYRNLALGLIALAVLGLSVQLFLMVRAAQSPSINEANPSTWDALWLVLSRDQYKPPNPFELRQASWDIQLSKHFWRYFHDQFQIYRLGRGPEWFYQGLPFAIGAVGAAYQAMRDRRRFLLVLSLVLMSTLFLVFYLNFRDDEVRDRDYFFVAGYHFFAIWIGLGVAALARLLRGEPQPTPSGLIEPPGGAIFGLGTGGLCLALSLLLLPQGWRSHDRSDFYVARDYAHNMLVPLEENAIVFTNGDNDTFPLWYIQEVEGVRRDVRVVNLSLLNTQWYIRQLRDQEPRVRITLKEEEIDRLHPFMLPDGEVVMVKDLMVRHILNENWGEREIYLAVTVPETMDLDNHMMMEGLAYRLVEEEADGEQVDVARTRHNLETVFHYRGVLDAQGRHNPDFYLDGTSRKLVQNYAAAYVRIAQHHLERDENRLAIAALEDARRINPGFSSVLITQGYLYLQEGDYVRAEETCREIIALGERSADAYRLLAAALEGQGRGAEVEATYRTAVEENPDSFDCYQLYFTYLWTQDRRGAAVDVIQDWLRRHPEDVATRQALDELLRPQPPEENEAGAARRSGAGE